MKTPEQRHHVVIIGGGFGGLYAARRMAAFPVDITLIDKRNFHLFQPLLYQVATGGLSPGDIASPLRAVLSKNKNVRVLQAEVKHIEPKSRTITFDGDSLRYDSLIVSAGSSHHYFGNDHWAATAPSLKTIEDALDIRRRIFEAYERAEMETDPEKQKALTTFVIVGGGPTGVELAGAMAELSHQTLKHDFRNINPDTTAIILVEGGEVLLHGYIPRLSRQSRQTLEKLGVTVRTNCMVTDVSGQNVTVKHDGGSDTIPTRTVLWAAGVKASPLGELLAKATGAPIDSGGRIEVMPDMTIPGFENIFIIGDMASFVHQPGNDSHPLPGTAPVAMQQGRYVARKIGKLVSGKRLDRPFRYRDKGSLAVIGRNAAVAQFGKTGVSGFFAWLLWIFVHIAYLIEFDNKLLVLVQWAGNYFTRKRGARLITETKTGSAPKMKAKRREDSHASASIW